MEPKRWYELNQNEQDTLKLAWSMGKTIQYHNGMGGESGWIDINNREPKWGRNSRYRVKPEETKVNHTIDGLEKIDWIRNHRNKTGCYLRDALLKWEELVAAGKTSSTDEPGTCTIIEADIENDQLVIQMLSKDYQVGPGKYKLVRVS